MEIPEHGKVQNAEWSYTEVLQSQISGTIENTSSVGSGLGFNLQYVLCLCPRTGGPDFGVENWGGRVLE